MTNEEKKDNRKLLFKKLKEQKLFTKFCFGVAEAFAYGDRPKESRESYLSFVAMEENMDNLVASVKYAWRMKPNKTIIQP